MTTPYRLLVVEDSENDAALVIRTLERKGYNIDATCVDSLEAVEDALGREHWDVVLCDYMLPTFTAIDLLGMTGEHYADLPVIVISGTITEETAVKALKAGAQDFVTKDNLARLGPAIERQMRENQVRADRRRAEVALKEQEALLSVIISNIPHFVFWKNRDLVYMGCSNSFAQVAGRNSPEDVIGKTDYDLPWQKEEADSFRKSDQQVIDSGEPMLNIEESQLQADGKKAVVLTGRVPLRDEVGEIIGVLGSFIDMTEMKHAERKLQDTVSELERFNRLAVGRELRMIELKREVNDMAEKAGLEGVYDVEFAVTRGGI